MHVISVQHSEGEQAAHARQANQQRTATRVCTDFGNGQELSTLVQGSDTLPAVQLLTRSA